MQTADYDPAVPQPLPRAFRRQFAAEDSEKVARIVRESERLEVDSVAGVTAGGDGARLRGVPAIGRGGRRAPAQPVGGLNPGPHRGGPHRVLIGVIPGRARASRPARRKCLQTDANPASSRGLQTF